MDTRGGKITWILDADDSGFESTTRRVRREADRTGREVDRSIGDGTKKANKHLEKFRRDLSISANFVRNFQVAMRGYNMTTLIMGVTAATGLVIELGAAVLATTGALYTLPAAGASVIGIFSTMKVATLGLSDAFDAVLKNDAEDLAEALEGLSPAGREVVRAFQDIYASFAPIQQAVQQKVFEGIAAEMRKVSDVSAPAVESGMLLVGGAINLMLKEASRVAQQPFFQGLIKDTFDNAAQSVATLTGAIEPLARTIAGLVKIGAPFVQMFNQWLVGLANQADVFVNSAEGAAKIESAIRLSIDALQLLGGLIGAVGGFFIELFRISNQEGMSLVGTLTEIFNKMTAWLKTEEGQAQMQALLKVTNEIFLTTLDVVGKVARVLLELIEGFNNLPTGVQDVVIQFLAWAAVLTPIVTYLTGLGASLSLTFRALMLVLTGAKTAYVGLVVLKQGFMSAQVAASVFSGKMGTIGGVLRTFANFVGKTLVKVLALAGKGFIALGRAMFMNPIGLIITAIVALVAAFIWLWNNVEGFRNFWIGLWEAIKAAPQAIADWFSGTFVPFFQGVWDAIVAGLQAYYNFWVGVWTAVINFVVGVVTAIWNTIVNVFTAIWNTIVTIFTAVWGFLQPILQFFLNLFIIVFGTILIVIITTLQNIWNTIVTVFTAVWNFLVTIWNAVWSFITTVATAIWNTIVTIFTAIWNTLSTIWNAIWNTIVTIATAIWNTLTSTWNAIWNTIVSIATAIWNTLTSIWNAIWNVITTVANAIWNTITTVFNAVWNTITSIMNAVWNIISSVWNRIWSTISNIVNNVKNTISNGFNAAKDFATNAFNSLRDAVSNAMESAKNKVSDIINGIKNLFSGAGSWLIDSGKKIIQGLIDGIGQMAGAVQRKAEEVMQKVRDLMPFSPAKEGPFSGKGWTLYSGRSIIQGLAEGIADSGRSAVNSARQVASAISGSIADATSVKFEMDANVSDYDAVSRTIGTVGSTDNSTHTENHNVYNITLPNVENAQDFARELKMAMVGRG